MDTTPQPARPEPVLDAARIAGAVSGTVTAIGAFLVLFGWATTDQVHDWAVSAGGIVTALGALAAVILPIITAYGARAQVTPLTDPRAVDGRPLSTAPPPVAEVFDEFEDEFVDEFDDEPGAHAAPEPEHAPETTPIPRMPRRRTEPTPIEAETVAALTAARPSPRPL